MARYHRARSEAELVPRLLEPDTAVLGGGTDLLVQIEESLIAPATLVDLRGVAGWDAIEWHAGGDTRIGATTRLARLEYDARIRTHFPVLAEACASVGTPAIRHMGTVGGNLCQRPRCWYYRRGVPCLKNGGEDCPAASGENQYHAILEGGPCWIVQPSDLAVALVALDATIEVVGPSGVRSVPAGDFWVLPSVRIDRETVLARGEVVRAVVLPARCRAGGSARQRYYKLMQRGAWDFALVSLAAVRRADGGVRLALGGVAPRPWRVPASIEEDAAAGPLDADAIETLAERALYDARPLARNGYKVALASALLRRGIADLWREDGAG